MTDVAMAHCLTSNPTTATTATETGFGMDRWTTVAALNTVIAMFADPRTHGERVTLAQLQAKRDQLGA